MHYKAHCVSLSLYNQIRPVTETWSRDFIMIELETYGSLPPVSVSPPLQLV